MQALAGLGVVLHCRVAGMDHGGLEAAQLALGDDVPEAVFQDLVGFGVHGADGATGLHMIGDGVGNGAAVDHAATKDRRAERAGALGDDVVHVLDDPHRLPDGIQPLVGGGAVGGDAVHIERPGRPPGGHDPLVELDGARLHGAVVVQGIDLVHPLHAAKLHHLFGTGDAHVLFRHLEDEADVVPQAIAVGGQKPGGGQSDRHVGVVAAVVGHPLMGGFERHLAHVVHLQAIHVGTKGNGGQGRVDRQIPVKTGEAGIQGDPVAELFHQPTAVGRGLELGPGVFRDAVQVVAHFVAEVAQGQQVRFDMVVVHQMIP